MKERKTLKEIYSQHVNAINLIIIIALFISGYLISWNFMMKPLNDSQFELCEQVARDVYAHQRENFIVEAPEDISVSINATTITVQLADSLHRGKVIAKLQNGELVMKRDMETGEAVLTSIGMGLLVLILAFLILVIVVISYETIKK